MKLSATKRRDGSRFLAMKRKVFCFVKRKKDYCGGGKNTLGTCQEEQRKEWALLTQYILAQGVLKTQIWDRL